MRGAQRSARCVVATPALVVHTYGYGLLVRLASRSLDHRVQQTTARAGHYVTYAAECSHFRENYVFLESHVCNLRPRTDQALRRHARP
jgi:hypothetical protein